MYGAKQLVIQVSLKLKYLALEHGKSQYYLTFSNLVIKGLLQAGLQLPFQYKNSDPEHGYTQEVTL